ncbi:MAG: type II toxin-antitoxin system VapC family toxin [Beijerinckiaceae bacterium]
MSSSRPLAIDSNVVIHAVEGEEADPVSAACRRLIFDMPTPQAFIVSELILAEVLVLPIRRGNSDLTRFYRRLFTDLRTFRMISVTRAVLLEAARLRSVSSLKLPDAIHLATATRAGCAAFVTMDQLATTPGAVGMLRPDDPLLLQSMGIEGAKPGER